MKPETEQIVATLEILTDGLYCSCVGDEPYGIMAWEVEEKGEFNFFNFLLDVQALTLLSADEFSDRLGQVKDKKTIQEYRELVNLLEANLSQLQIYSYQAPYLSEEHTNFYGPPNEIELPVVIIGLTPDKEWLALAPTLFFHGKLTPVQFAIPTQEPTEATANLIESIQIITGDLVRTERGEKILERDLMWQIAVTASPSSGIEKNLDVAGYIDIFEIDYFWDLEAPEGTEKYYDWKIQEFKLKQFFKKALIESRVYTFYFHRGEYQAHYVLGKNNNGDWMGVFSDTYSW